MMRSTICGLLLGTLVAACGGGGADFGGGISGSGKMTVRVGVLEQDGAVVIDGLTFEASSAIVTVSGAMTPVADLKQGMVAVVTGTVDDTTGSATAETVEIEEVLKGIVQAKLDAVTMAVLGQTVEITAETVFGAGINPASLAGLLVGDPVEVYGFLKSPGVVNAARVEREAALSELRLTGVIANLDGGGQKFDIGGQRVEYSGADTSDLPGGAPANGQVVEVRGESMLNGLDEVVANEVKRADGDGPDDVEDVEIEGFVTSVISPTEFVLTTQSVQTSLSTIFEGGDASEIVVGAKLKVEGSISSGVLNATKVRFGESVKVESDVDTVVGTTITLVGLPGVTVTVTASTAFEGNATALGDVVAGDHVKIRGRLSGSSSLTATLVDETDPKNEVEIQGPIDSTPAPSDPTLSILGLQIDTSAVDENDFEDEAEQVIGRSAFFAAALPGVLVKVEGNLSGVTVTWDQAELQGEDP